MPSAGFHGPILISLTMFESSRIKGRLVMTSIGNLVPSACLRFRRQGVTFIPRWRTALYSRYVK
jgi:hypothetical protein